MVEHGCSSTFIPSKSARRPTRFGQSTVFDLVVNLKTAETLGLVVPQSILAQATEVVQ